MLKVLRRKGLIEYAPEKVSGKEKLYVLSEKGKESLRTILINIGTRYFSRYVDPYASIFLEHVKNLFEISGKQKILCALNLEPVREMLDKTDTTYLKPFQKPPSTYSLIICGMVGTLMLYGWKREELSLYLSQMIQSLNEGGTFVTVEIEKTDNIFSELFFKEVVGYSRVPGLSESELRNLLEDYSLIVKKIDSWKGLLIGVAIKPGTA